MNHDIPVCSQPTAKSPFERFHAVAFDLVSSQLLPFTTTGSQQMSKFFEITPLQNTIRAVFLAHLRQKEQEYNQQHQRILQALPSDTSLRKRHNTEQDLLKKELEKRFGRRYTGPILLMTSDTEFTQDRWCAFLLHQYTLTQPQRQEAQDLIFSTKFNQQLLYYGQFHGLNTRDAPFSEFSYSAVMHIEKKAHEILQEHQLPGNLSQCDDVLGRVPSDTRKILLMNAYAKSYYAIQALITGSLEELKNLIKKHPDYKSNFQLSARISFEGEKASFAEESEFVKQVQDLRAVFAHHQLEQSDGKKELTTLKFSKEQFPVSADKLHALCTQFYTECVCFYRTFSDFVALLQVHKDKDMQQYKVTVAQPVVSSGPRLRGSSLLSVRTSGGGVTSSSPMAIDRPSSQLASSATALAASSSPRTKRPSSLVLHAASGSSSPLPISRSSSGEFPIGIRYETLVEERLKSFVQVRDVFEEIVKYCPQSIREKYDTQSNIYMRCNYFGSE